VYQQFQGKCVQVDRDNKDDCHNEDGLLYKLEKLCVLQGERVKLTMDVHTSKVIGHFGVGKTITTLQKYFIGS